MGTNPDINRKHQSVAFKAGVYSALLFWLAFIGLVVTSPSDPQTPIGLVLSPAYAAWFGFSLWLLTLGWQQVRETVRGRNRPEVGTFIAIVLGLIGAGGMIAFVAGEHYQATHPTIYPAARSTHG